MTAAFANLIEILLMTLAGVYQGIRQDFNFLEIALLIGIFAALRSGWKPEWKWAVAWESRLSGWSRHRVRACLALAVAAIAIRAALVPVLPVPKPVVSDEFSHLLLADTLLHGRAANPMHPLWVHFETLHVIQRPHYASDYFPGHAAVLAASQWITGQPWPGILLLSGFCCATICWMLQGWMPARWALFGGSLALLRFSIGSYWVNSYYGGFLPAIGGALVAGAYPRLRRRATVAGSFVFASGLAILAFTRPFEGALFSMPFVGALLWTRYRDVRVLLPLAATAAVTLVTLGAYFERVTGSPTTTTYSVNQKEYGWPLAIAWAKPAAIDHRNVELHNYYMYEVGEHEKVDSPVHFVEFLAFRVQEYWRFFVGPMLTVPLLFLGGIWRKRRVRVLLAGLGGAVAAVLLEGASSPHYISPATAAIVAVIVEGVRRLRLHHGGVLLSRFAPLTLVLVFVLRIAAANAGLPYTQKLNYQSWCCKVQGNYAKHRAIEYLATQPGRHLVIVKPKQDPLNLFQWIYNGADIDGSRIVWARDLGPAENERLIEYFRGRQVWTIDPNESAPRLQPFAAQAAFSQRTRLAPRVPATGCPTAFEPCATAAVPRPDRH